MLKKRIIPCLDVRDGQVVKGVQFRNHEVVGDILELAKRYSDAGADELVFYAITASSDDKNTDRQWVKEVANQINIPFCVAGGIRSLAMAEEVLANGADKVSINSPALENPQLIEELAKRFGSQCVVIGIDSWETEGEYQVLQYTGDEKKTVKSRRSTLEWAREVVHRGAGEIVLNCMNQDGVRKGYDLVQTKLLAETVNVPVVASGGAGEMSHFLDLFTQTRATGGLAASVFHKGMMTIPELKDYLAQNDIEVRQ
ncbi:imidazole glycerol phosphate synthase subunit HisF [Aquella oligotrophica]|uniref:Imidazole glycerol phosphate synthase subunit HisF n=1 Tax=Aquella oligotrophica TaxID=2067065 RepID=A0A2I7N3H4_9NEIS|nr:imidazole glycerol phosphate synthase subunit HisF [Aquella oligotrophica]AUR50999.1 imidazole glycerol phosphate synthase subunit HisF [Aquella oligotrophica]